MNSDDVRAAVLDAIGEVAPEADLGRLEPDSDLRDELEIDSMDALNIAIGIHERTGVDIPATDYPRLATLDALVAYVSARASEAQA